jgi:iron complex outermembrane receptor protein
MAISTKSILLAGAVTVCASSAAQGAVETVVVTAERRSENIQAVPISIQAFTAKQITDLGIKSSIDISQFTPNVDIALVAGNGNQPIITIRGVGLNDYDTNNAGPNGVYLDDVYLSSPASQTFQTFDLDRIEVLKGPQGTLYGRNTSGGAINFISVKPSDDFTGNFHAEYGAYGTYQLEGAIGGQITDGLDGRIAVVHNGSGGYTLNALTGNRENGANNYAGRAQLQWKPIDDLTVLLNVHGGTVANRPAEYRHMGSLDSTGGTPAHPSASCSPAEVLKGSASDGGVCTDIFGYGTPTNFYGGAYNRQDHLKVHNFGVSLRGDYVMGDITLTSLSAFEHNDKIHPEDSDASPNRLLEINFGVRNATFTQEFRADWNTENNDLIGGLYYLDENLHQNQPLFILLDFDKFFDPIFGVPNTGDGVAEIATDQSKQITDSYAAFLHDTYSITDQLKLVLGGRFTGESKSFAYSGGATFQSGGMDHFPPVTPILPPPGESFNKKLSNTSFNWLASVNYHFTDDIMAYASVSTGFKSGGFNGSFIGATPDPDLVALQLLPIKPEQVTAYEIGEKASLFDGRLIVNGSLFYSAYRDEQVFILVPIAPLVAVNILENARKAHMQGADLEVIGKPLDNLTLSATLGLLDAKIDSNERIGGTDLDPILDHNHQLPLSPHVTLSTYADYKCPIWDGMLDLQFSANYKSHQFFDLINSPFLTQRAYWLENARIGYTFDDNQWEVAGYVRNISGQKYFLDIFDLSFVGFYQGIFGTPRTYGAEVNYRF